jgi:hypothetical protein
MDRVRLPVAALALFLPAACHAAAPTAPADRRTSNTQARFDGDSVPGGVDRNGNLLGSGN